MECKLVLLKCGVSGLLPYLIRRDSLFADRSSGLLSEHKKQNVCGTAKLSCDWDLSGMEVVVHSEQECEELMVSKPRAQRNPYISGVLKT